MLDPCYATLVYAINIKNRSSCFISVISSTVQYSSRLRLETTVAGGYLSVLRIDATKLSSLAVGKLVHGGLGEVETSGSVVNGQDVDGLAVVCDAVAGTALGGVPARNTLVATNAGERWNVSLSVPSVLGDETIGAVRAGQSSQRAAAVIVAGIVGNCTH
jgi:hypothetical protein